MKQNQSAYEKDFYAWTIDSAYLLRSGQLQKIDVEHIAEEIESMGKSQKRELVHRLAILIAHLLKWQYQPVRRSRSWELTIKEQRIELSELLEDSPSLKNELERQLTHSYEKALLFAEKETGLAQDTFAATCPFDLKNLLKQGYFPK